jgi:hypothetical protein
MEGMVIVALIVDAMSSWTSASLIRQLSAFGSLQSQDFSPFTLDTRMAEWAEKECLHGGSCSIHF